MANQIIDPSICICTWICIRHLHHPCAHACKYTCDVQLPAGDVSESFEKGPRGCQEAPGRFLGESQEVPRRLPKSSCERPRSVPGGSQEGVRKFRAG